MKKYLVLGGNGFIGKYIVKKLMSNNQIVVADFNLEDPIEHPNVVYKYIDFINCQDFGEYLNGIDTVIHLISTIGPNDQTENINKEICENVFPTNCLLENMVKYNVPKIIFISSGGTIYGEHDPESIREDEPKEPICNYGILKELIEKYIKLYNLYYGIDYRIIRLANPYSDITKKGKKQGIIPIFIDQILQNKPITIWGDGKDTRDYIYIEDAISAIIEIIEYTGNKKIFNVGTGIGYSINEIIEIIKTQLPDSKIDISYLDARLCDVKYNVLNIDRIKTEIGWVPQTTLEQGIQKVIKKKKNDTIGE